MQLKNVIPKLITAFLDVRSKPQVTALQSGQFTVRYAICKILYTFCKVRGEKVIVGFFNNEPQYLEPLLSDFERGSSEESSPNSLSWEGRYILLLWLSHLMLSPFDLATMSSVDGGTTPSFGEQLQLPEDTPGIALRVLPICLKYLTTATRERNAASQLLVRLCLRPDMRQIGLLDAVAHWAIDFFRASDREVEIHKNLGVLAFLSGLVASGSQREIGNFLAAILQATQRLATEDNANTIKSSAVARKFFVKIFRNIAILYLQAPPEGVDTTNIVEDVVEFLLDTLADGDTLVRFAASKAMSMVALKLDAGMADMIVDAILDRLDQNVLLEDSQRNLDSVNPLEWHGLILTLSHLLYRRAVSTDRLPKILNALLLGLTFEQRSATGASTGTNVRDAANFGIWAIARRYTTAELQKVDLASIRIVQDSEHKVSITQMLAIELIQSACLDPAGNIRRGSSAVLQELVGRHPDTIVEGIALIQIVDFHAVGLRQRAITEVTFNATKLSPIYWGALFKALLGWRGIGAVDEASRVAAARAIGAQSATQDPAHVRKMLKTIQRQLKSLAPRQVEQRHGLMLSIAAVLNQEQDRNDSARRRAFSTGLVFRESHEAPDRSDEELCCLMEFWSVLGEDIELTEKDFMSPSLRPGLTATAWLRLFRTLLTLGTEAPALPKLIDFMDKFNLSLGRGEASVLEEIPQAVLAFTVAIDSEQRDRLVTSWLSYLGAGSKTSHARSAGRVIALGAALGIWADHLADSNSVLEILTRRCTTEASIEERVDALKALKLVVSGIHQRQPCDLKKLEAPGERRSLNKVLSPADHKTMVSIVQAALIALNDYTTDDRGDTGSLVRIEALDLVEAARVPPFFFGWCQENRFELDEEITGIGALDLRLRNATVRLSLERLDKVRARAWRLGPKVIDDYSSYEYFYFSLQNLYVHSHFLPGRENQAAIKEYMESFFEGYCSSAGGTGSESLIQVSREALAVYLDTLDVVEHRVEAPFGEKRDAMSLQEPTLLQICNTFCDLIRKSLGKITTKTADDDRVLLPVLEVIAYILDMGLMERLDAYPAKFSYVYTLYFQRENVLTCI